MLRIFKTFERVKLNFFPKVEEIFFFVLSKFATCFKELTTWRIARVKRIAAV